MTRYHRIPQTLHLGRTREELQRELAELTDKFCQLSDHMKRAAEACDHVTVNDTSYELYGLDQKVEETSFLLSLMDEALS